VVDETARRTPVEGGQKESSVGKSIHGDERKIFFPSSSGASMHTQHMKKEHQAMSHEHSAKKAHSVGEERASEARAKGKKEKLAASGTRKTVKKLAPFLFRCCSVL
jgi:hypothetical protein